MFNTILVYVEIYCVSVTEIIGHINSHVLFKLSVASNETSNIPFNVVLQVQFWEKDVDILFIVVSLWLICEA